MLKLLIFQYFALIACLPVSDNNFDIASIKYVSFDGIVKEKILLEIMHIICLA